jgi:hypothetical protein
VLLGRCLSFSGSLFVLCWFAHAIAAGSQLVPGWFAFGSLLTCWWFTVGSLVGPVASPLTRSNFAAGLQVGLSPVALPMLCGRPDDAGFYVCSLMVRCWFSVGSSLVPASFPGRFPAEPQRFRCCFANGFGAGSVLLCHGPTAGLRALWFAVG